MNAAPRLYQPCPERKRQKPRDYNVFQTRHHRFLTQLVARNNVTDEDLALLAGATPSDTRGRRKELCVLGLCRMTGQVKNSRGRKTSTWGVTPQGRKLARKLKLLIAPSTHRTKGKRNGRNK